MGQTISHVFELKLTALPGTSLPVDAVYQGAVGTFAVLAAEDYNRVRTVGFQYVYNAVTSTRPVKGKEQYFVQKFILWGLYRCLEAIVASGPNKEGNYNAAQCEYGPSRDMLVGNTTFTKNSPYALAATDDYCIAFDKSPGVNADSRTALTSLDNDGRSLVNRADLPQSSSSSINAVPDPKTCGYNRDRSEWPAAEIGRPRGPKNESAVSLTMMEAMLELAAKQPRAETLQDPWNYEYTSVKQGYTLTLQTPPDEKRPFHFSNIMETMGVLAGRLSTPVNFELIIETVQGGTVASERVILDGKIRKVGEEDEPTAL